MEEISSYNDWDLHALVRSCRYSDYPKPAAAEIDQFSRLPLATVAVEKIVQEEEEEEIRSISDPWNSELAKIQRGVLEFGELHKVLSTGDRIRQRTPATAVASVHLSNHSHIHGFPRQQQPNRVAPRSRRRKIQQKRVVRQVPADGVVSDVWAWRKYGQKPIKGSPYPRGYYRCSTLKGCTARKQVERSRTDPDMFIVTYTGEHNHPAPTHRNSLAGSTRQKLPACKDSENAAGEGNAPSSSLIWSSPVASGLSPTTPLMTASVDNKPDAEDEYDAQGRLLLEEMEVMDEGDFLFVCSEDADAEKCDDPLLNSAWLENSDNSVGVALGGA